MESEPLMPQLRFPDFQDAPRWVEESFSHLYRFGPTNTFSRDQLNYTSGTVKNIHYGDIHTRFQAFFDIRREVVPFINPAEIPNGPGLNTLCEEGDLIFADASEDVADVGKSIEIVELDGQQLVSGTHTILAKRIGFRLIVGFGGHLFRSPRIRARIRRESQGAKVSGLSPGRLATIPVFFPPDKAEQKKIAECLMSLDELIEAEGRKLEALRTHKKGLMQSLFPREGETVPSLRFPQFCNDGEWERRPLSHIAENLDNRRVPITEQYRKKGNIPYYGASGVVDFVADYIFDDDLLCVSEDGANLVTRTYPIAFPISGKTWVNNHAHVLRFTLPTTQKLVETYLNETNLCDFITGMAQPKLNRAMLDIIPIPLPKPEEQRSIANCLTSLDALITAQAKKFDTLKLHKQGLMQGLFPSTEEA